MKRHNYQVTFTKEQLAAGQKQDKNRTKKRKNMIPKISCPFKKFTLSLFLVVMVFYLYAKNEN